MTTVTNPYEALYTNLKNQFTVIHEGTECTVGEFMRMKSMHRSESSLPVACVYSKTASLANIVEYVNDKLMVKNAPEKDRTIKRFPLRTSLSSLLSATAACAMILSCGIFAIADRSASNLPYTADASEYTQEETVNETESEAEIFDTESEKR